MIRIGREWANLPFCETVIFISNPIILVEEFKVTHML